MAEREIAWPVIFDPKGNLQMRWQVLSLPMHFVLDQEQIVRYRGNSFHEAANVAKSLVGTDESALIAKFVTLALKALDANHNGQLEKTELPDDKKAIFEAVDLNGDGSLSIDELTMYYKKIGTTTKADPSKPSASDRDAEKP